VRRQRGIAEPYSVADAVATMVKFRQPVDPNPQWHDGYQRGLEQFEQQLAALNQAS